MAPSKDARISALSAAREARVRELAAELKDICRDDLLRIMMALIQFWTNESVELESDTTRGAKGRRDDCRTAASLTDALCTDLENLPADNKPTPADAAVVEYLSGTAAIEPAPVPPAVAPAEEEYVVSPTPFVNPAPVSGLSPTVGRALTFADLRARPAGDAPLHRSYSQVESYADCGLKYRLQRRELGVIQRPAWALVGGTALHSTIETLERGTPQGEGFGHSDDATSSLWLGCLNDSITAQALKTPEFGMDAWHAAARGAEGYTWWMHEGLDMVKRYCSWRDGMRDAGWRVATLNGLPGIEWPFEIIISGNRVVGKIDLILESRDGSLMVVDFKGGKSTPVDTLQLKTYSVAIGEPRPTGAYLMLRSGKFIEHSDVAAPDAFDEVTWRYGDMDSAERAGIYMARPSSYCGGCSVRHACPVAA